MADTRIILSGLWEATMLTYLLGDVLRIFSGDFEAAKLGGQMEIAPGFYLGMAALFVLPIAMVFLSLVLPHSVDRWANIILSTIFFAVNLVGLPTYPSLYDKLLIVVGLVFNALNVWYAWRWV